MIKIAKFTGSRHFLAQAMISGMINLSSYANSLSEEAKARYREKIAIIGGVDPFSGSIGVLCERMPPVESIDIVSYLVLRTSFVTAEQLKAQKGQEAQNQFLNCCVKELKTKQLLENVLSLEGLSS